MTRSNLRSGASRLFASCADVVSGDALHARLRAAQARPARRPRRGMMDWGPSEAAPREDCVDLERAPCYNTGGPLVVMIAHAPATNPHTLQQSRPPLLQSASQVAATTSCREPVRERAHTPCNRMRAQQTRVLRLQVVVRTMYDVTANSETKTKASVESALLRNAYCAKALRKGIYSESLPSPWALGQVAQGCALSRVRAPAI